jgi:hypothetical protein
MVFSTEKIKRIFLLNAVEAKCLALRLSDRSGSIRVCSSMRYEDMLGGIYRNVSYVIIATNYSFS